MKTTGSKIMPTGSGLKPGAGKARPMPTMKPLASLAPAPDPLEDLPHLDDIEESCKQELSALEAGFRDRLKQEAERVSSATDGDFRPYVSSAPRR